MKHTLRCHGFGDAGEMARAHPRNRYALVTTPRAKTAPAHEGLRPQLPLALSLGLPIQRVWAAPRFALSTILARTARAFHYVTGSRRAPVLPA
jgi:hypothetical protein